jgi:uncharacterized membrane protein YdfJ with MMPL/SSD domain
LFAGWGSWVARFRWPVLAVALVAVVGAGVWGLGVFGELTEGGYNDPNSESAQAAEVAQAAFGEQGGDLVVIYTPATGTVDDPILGAQVRASLSALPTSAVTATTSYFARKAPQFAAADRSSAIALVTLAGDDDAAKLDSFRAVDDRFAVTGVRVQLAGAAVLTDASARRSTEDLGTAEMISLPVTLILLVLIFGSLVAAALPVLVGGAAVAGSLGILHAVAAHHDVNSFAVNVASLLGLGMAIDYGLFLVGRFREEQAQGRTPAEAVARTVATAGRTVVFSATLLMIALAGLLLFPQGFLKSLAYGGLAAVFLAALLSLTLLPALLAVLGPAVDRLPVRLPSLKGAGDGWTRLAGFVLRRPVAVALPILAGLLLLAAPVRGVHFGESDERILPATDPGRQAIEALKADYPQFTGDGVQIVLRDAGDPSAFAAALGRVPGVDQVTPASQSRGVTLFTATLTVKDAFTDQARDVVDEIRALPVPPGARLLVGGTTARNIDSLTATADKLPLMVGMLVGATLLLMFLAFGSVLLPVKAVLMSALSLCATFGALVWMFQSGHLAGLLGITPAPLEIGIVVLMAAVVFGLSTDYEVFLLSRMVEARTRGASTAEAVSTGLARTGRVISAAALLLVVVTGAFALSAVSTMRFVGVGMIIALVLDATVVRMLLVPAVLRLLGDAAWWAPGPLRRLQRRAGLAEREYAEEPAPASTPTRHPAASTPARHAAAEDTEVLRRLDGPRPVGEISGAHALRPAHARASDDTELLPRLDDTAVLNGPPAESTAVESGEAAPMSRALTPRYTPDESWLPTPATDPLPPRRAGESWPPSPAPRHHEEPSADVEVVDAEVVVTETAGPVEVRAAGEAPEPEVADAELIEEPNWAGLRGDDPFTARVRAESPPAGRAMAADLSEWLPAVPTYEGPPQPADRNDDAFYFGNPALPSAAPHDEASAQVPRPADLADHMRENRTTDLSQYRSAPRLPQMREPADDQPPPPRRPATLADLSARRHGERGVSGDLSDQPEAPAGE